MVANEGDLLYSPIPSQSLRKSRTNGAAPKAALGRHGRAERVVSRGSGTNLAEAPRRRVRRQPFGRGCSTIRGSAEAGTDLAQGTVGEGEADEDRTGAVGRTASRARSSTIAPGFHGR